MTAKIYNLPVIRLNLVQEFQEKFEGASFQNRYNKLRVERALSIFFQFEERWVKMAMDTKMELATMDYATLQDGKVVHHMHWQSWMQRW